MSLIEDMTRIARSAGDTLKAHFNDLPSLIVESKGAADLVSNADHESEAIIRAGMAEAYPEFGFHGEESGASEGNAEYRCHVDGLDGTLNFLHGIPLWCISMGVERRGVLENAVIYNPLADEMFTASRGSGAFLNGRKLEVSGQSALSESLIALYTPGAKNPAAAEELASVLMRVLPGIGNMRRTGSVALDLAYVAAGRFDGFFELKTNPWDVAAGALLISEAGGVVTGSSGSGEPLNERSILASNDSLHPQLAALIAHGRKDFAFRPAHTAIRASGPTR